MGYQFFRDRRRESLESRLLLCPHGSPRFYDLEQRVSWVRRLRPAAACPAAAYGGCVRRLRTAAAYGGCVRRPGQARHETPDFPWVKMPRQPLGSRERSTPAPQRDLDHESHFYSATYSRFSLSFDFSSGLVRFAGQAAVAAFRVGRGCGVPVRPFWAICRNLSRPGA